jgi:hypothetical protein
MKPTLVVLWYHAPVLLTHKGVRVNEWNGRARHVTQAREGTKQENPAGTYFTDRLN